MPYAARDFPFERKIAAWCQGFSKTMTGNPHRAFLVTFDGRGCVATSVFGEGKILEPERERLLQSGSKGWLSWRPFEAPQSLSVGWQNVSREAMERLLGERFPEADFVSYRTGGKIEFPEEWPAVF
jgi:hypothetical protein